MENNESNIKPQQTGGLKLMTVFIVVLALHVVVIGGFTVYHLMSGGSTDTDLLADKTHKTPKSAADGATAPDTSAPAEAGQADKTAPVASIDGSGAPMTIPAPVDNAPSAAMPAPSSPAPVAMTPVAPAPSHGPVITPVPVPAPVRSVAEAAPAPAPEATAPVTVNGTSYTVKHGDSLAKIARQNHTSVAKLKAANSLPNDMLHIGQKLVIPAKAQVASTAAPAPAALADNAGSTTILGNSTAAPSMSVPAPAVKTPAASAAQSARTYTVVKGDTLTKIAHKFRTTPTAIMASNNLTDATKLNIGRKLKIPGQEARSATTNEPAPASAPSQVQTKGEPTAQLANFIQ